MLTLQYPYVRRNSTLPRRTFHVDLTVDARHVACQVVAPDALAAEQVVRKHLPLLEPGLGSFQFDLVREVGPVASYDHRMTVHVPVTFERVLEVTYR